jgi:translation elongation factor EF-4
MKEVHEAKVGDTFFSAGQSQPQLYPGFSPVKPVVFSGLYPVDADDFLRLSEALGRLSLSDSSVAITRESSTALGQGFRVGYLGRLHMDVFRQRLFEEYGSAVINTGLFSKYNKTAPVVPYRVRIGDSEEIIKNPATFPDDTSLVDCFLEPMANVSLYF